MRKRNSKRPFRIGKVKFVVEGFTEENYLNGVCEIKQYEEIENITNTRGGGAKTVLEKAKKEFKTGKFGKVFAWFDIDRDEDKTSEVNDLASSLSSIGINLIVSKPCTEAWLLAYFRKVPQSMLNNESNRFCKDLTKEYMAKYNLKSLEYDKNDISQLQKYIKPIDIEVPKKNYCKYKDNFSSMFDYFDSRE